MQGFPQIIQNTRLGSLVRLEYVPTTWVASWGFANQQLLFLGGITLKSGRSWLNGNGVLGERSFKNELQITPNGPLFTRRMAAVLNGDDTTVQREFLEMAQHRFVVRGVTPDGFGYLLATPQYPATFSLSTDYGANPQQMVKHQIAFSTQTPQPLYRWDFVPIPILRPSTDLGNFTDDFS
jgi:hypothetical protein